MDYLESLRSGSDFHEVSIKPGGFTIKAANDTEECLARFHEIVEEAIERASEEGYEILPHRSSMDSKGRFDFALITEV
jgi:hypothetical protein